MAYLPSAADLYAKAMSELQGQGSAAKYDLQQSYRNAVGQGMQSLTSSGMAGTTVAPSMRIGYMQQYQRSLNALGQQMQQQRLGAMSTFGLGGMQMENAQKQLELQQKNSDLAERQFALQAQNMKFQQGIQGGQYDATYGMALKNQQALGNAWSNFRYGRIGA